MTNWLPLTSEVPITKEVRRVIGGSECKVSLSPYDVPQAIRGYEDKEHNCFIIELKYLTEEPTIEKQSNEFTRIEIGQNSNRIYKIKLDMKAIEHHIVTNILPTLVNDAMSNAAKTAIEATTQHRAGRLSDYFDLTKKAVLSNSGRFLADFAKHSS